MPDHPRQADLESLLDALSEAGVDHILVGGAAAVIHGAPVTTQDLDIVPRVDPENLDRLMSVLTSLDARIRDVAGRDLRPDRDALGNAEQLRLTTSLGPLDVVRHLHDRRGYDDLLPHTVEVADGDLRLRVLDLSTLIAIKSATGKTSDKLVVPILIARAREREGGLA